MLEGRAALLLDVNVPRCGEHVQGCVCVCVCKAVCVRLCVPRHRAAVCGRKNPSEGANSSEISSAASRFNLSFVFK